MNNRNKTLNIQYRFLSQRDFPEVYKTNLLAFSDYIVPMQLTPLQFESHLAQNSVELELSVGAFYENDLVGYTLNGFGIWNGEKTVYDAGTGVIPKFRGKGIGEGLFYFLLPKLKTMGSKQMLLEVISNNQKAINLYQKLGFEETRKLLFFEQTSPIGSIYQNEIKIQQIENPNWKMLEKFWDAQTSWQFSSRAFPKSLLPKIIFGAYLQDKCIGYSVLYSTSGIISQIAVEKDHRRKKVGTLLLAEMQKYLEASKKLRFSNVDRNLKSLVRFAGSLDFTPTISQLEMILEL